MKRKGILVAGLLLLALAGYSQVKSGAFRLLLQTLLQHNVPETGVASAALNRASILFLDARELREFEVSHLPGAIHAGYESFSTDALPPMEKNQRIVVYCSVGYRSEKITAKLIDAGFLRVSNLYGGIFEWVNQGNPVFSAEGPTRQVHAYDRNWGIWLRKGHKVYE